MASDFDPDNRVVKNSQGAVIQQGGNVSSRLPGRTTFTATPAEAVQGGNPASSVSIDTLKGRVEAAADPERIPDRHIDPRDGVSDLRNTNDRSLSGHGR